MGKKQFSALADMVKDHNGFADDSDYHRRFTKDQIEALAAFCEMQNPAFNRGRWLGYIAGTNGPSGGAR